MIRPADIPGQNQDQNEKQTRRSTILTNAGTIDDDLIDEEQLHQLWKKDRSGTYKALMKYHQMNQNYIAIVRRDICDYIDKVINMQNRINELQAASVLNLRLRRDVGDEELNKLHEALEVKSQLLVDVQTKQKELESQMKDIQQERDQYRDAFAKQSLDSLNSNGAVAKEKSYELPDPDQFKDARSNPKYELWSRQLRYKLKNNASQFPTASIRVAYAIGRLGGEAADRVLVRLEANENAFSDAEDVIEYLDIFYKQANRDLIARNKLRTLHMKDFDRPQASLSEFLQLALKSKLPEAVLGETLRTHD